MKASIPVVARNPFVAQLEFASKAEAQRWFEQVITSETDWDWSVGAFYLLNALHPDWTSISKGMRAIDRRTLPSGHVRVFVTLADETEMMIRHWRCFEEGPRTRLSNALRQVVFQRVADFKRDLFASGPVLCAASGRELMQDECDIDHAPPWLFATLVTAWLAQEAREPESFAFIRSPHADLSLLASEADAASFLSFHDERAVLRPMHSHTNRYARDFASSVPAEAHP